MSDLVVVGFESESKADEVLVKLGQLQKSHLIDLEDAAVRVGHSCNPVSRHFRCLA